MKHLHTCRDCGRIITDRHEIRERTCSDCLDTWFREAINSIAVAVIGVPSSALRAVERQEGAS